LSGSRRNNRDTRDDEKYCGRRGERDAAPLEVVVERAKSRDELVPSTGEVLRGAGEQINRCRPDSDGIVKFDAAACSDGGFVSNIGRKFS
jgi:hypothetical protein